MEMAHLPDPGDQVPGIGSGICIVVELNDSTAGSLSAITMHHTKPAAVFQESQSIRLGAQSSRGYEIDAWLTHQRPV